jgi:chromodomain-helicase-DNA-binding protein 7
MVFCIPRFKTFARLDKKSDENLSDYYKVFIAMCKRQAGEKLLEEERGLDGLIDDIGEDHAKLILDRLELLSKLREIAKHPKLDERLKLCENNLDTPDWWESGKHDRELVRAVLKYGLYRSDQYILNDTDFPFSESEKHYVRSLEVLKSFKFDNPADLFKLAMGEMPSASPKAEAKAESISSPKKDESLPETETEKIVDSETKPNESLDSEDVSVTPEVDENTTTEEPKSPKSPKKSVEKEAESADPDNLAVEEKKTEEISEESKDTANSNTEEPEKMETDKVTTEILSEVAEDEKMEVDCENLEAEKPAEKETKIEETETEEKTDKDLQESENLADLEEKMEVAEIEDKPVEDSETTTEPSIEPVVEAEKEEITTSEEEKSEPKIEESPAADVCAIEPKSPEKISKEAETKEPEDLAIVVKKEPGLERSEGEQKVIDTVVIDDDDASLEKPTDAAGSSNQAEQLRARFPDLEVFQPLMKLKQLDAIMMKGDVKDNLKSLSRVFDTSMVVKWFRDFALEKRISHIIYCVEKGVWPVGKSYSAYSGCLGIDLDLPLYETVKRLNAHDDKRSSSSTPDIITITTDHHQLSKSGLTPAQQSLLHQSMSAMASGKGKKGQKRHIAIDVETERAKLHALLNNTNQLVGQKSNWNEDDVQEHGRRGSGLQPPPAHQPSPRGMNQYKPTVTIPGTSSTLTPIDLSSR